MKKIEKYVYLPTGRNDIYKIDDSNRDDFINSMIDFFNHGKEFLDYKFSEKTRIFEPNRKMNLLEFKECNVIEEDKIYVFFDKKYQNMHGGAFFIGLDGYSETHFSFLQNRKDSTDTNKGLYVLGMTKRKPWDNRDEKIYVRL